MTETDIRMHSMCHGYLGAVANALARLPVRDITAVVAALRIARKDFTRLFIMGNGGSGSTASHIAGDLAKSVGLDIRCLNDTVVALTAWANDDSYHSIFYRQFEGLAQAGDIVIVLSGSGQSPNIVGAVGKAREMGCVTIALTGQAWGEDGGLAAVAADHSVVVPSDNMEIIEDVHLMIGHMIKTALMEG